MARESRNGYISSLPPLRSPGSRISGLPPCDSLSASSPRTRNNSLTLRETLPRPYAAEDLVLAADVNAPGVTGQGAHLALLVDFLHESRKVRGVLPILLEELPFLTDQVGMDRVELRELGLRLGEVAPGIVNVVRVPVPGLLEQDRGLGEVLDCAVRTGRPYFQFNPLPLMIQSCIRGTQ